MRALNLKARRFGRLVGISPHGRIGSFVAWRCLCDCGKHTRISSRHLVSGHTKSCGCFRRDFTTAKNTKHKLSGTTEHRSWASLRQRCDNPQNAKYKDYGGRGIKYCARWNDFKNFLADMGRKPARDYMIERIDNNGDYTKSNCRWATKAEQARNKQSSRVLTVGSDTRHLLDWAAASGLGAEMIWRRIKRGWPARVAVTKPSRASI